MTNDTITKLNYTQFQQFVYSLIEKQEITITKDWNIARVLYKDKSMSNLEPLNFTQIRSRFAKTYNILVSKDDFKEVFLGIAEEITPKPDNVDEWVSEIYDYLEANRTTKIKLKDLAFKVFNLSNKELTMSTQHRLGSILKLLGYNKNTKTKEWIKVNKGDTEDTMAESVDTYTVEGISKVSSLTKGDTYLCCDLDCINKLKENNKLLQYQIKILKDEIEEYKQQNRLLMIVE